MLKWSPKTITQSHKSHWFVLPMTVCNSIFVYFIIIQCLSMLLQQPRPRWKIQNVDHSQSVRMHKKIWFFYIDDKQKKYSKNLLKTHAHFSFLYNINFVVIRMDKTVGFYRKKYTYSVVPFCCWIMNLIVNEFCECALYDMIYDVDEGTDKNKSIFVFFMNCVFMFRE